MFENKKKFALWMYPETLERVEKVYREDGCRSKSEFIEKAIEFYLGYLSGTGQDSYLSAVLVSTLKSVVAESDNRQSRLLFKLAVEIAMLENVVAAELDVDPDSLERLRGECVKTVKRLNGNFRFEDAAEWQRG